MSFEASPFWASAGTPNAGDIIHLKLFESTYFKVKAVVDRVEGDEVIATVEAILEWQTERPARIGPVTRYLGRRLGVHREQVFGVTKVGG